MCVHYLRVFSSCEQILFKYHSCYGILAGPQVQRGFLGLRVGFGVRMKFRVTYLVVMVRVRG